jgi:hypothetical protein
MNKLTADQQNELQKLANLPDSGIDTSDIPEVKDWSKAQRGRFFRPGSSRRIPIYLDADVQDFLMQQAQQHHKDASTLANELLRKNAELISLVRR